MPTPANAVLALPGLLAFWDFHEAPGSPRRARGPHPFELREHPDGRPVARAAAGPFGAHAARFDGTGWLEIPRQAVGSLDRHGPQAQVTVLAWLRRAAKPQRECQAVAGIWDETHKHRQYCLFLDLTIWNSGQQACGHVSYLGGPTPGYRWCMDTAIGGSELALDRWVCIAFTYNALSARILVDGRLDPREGFNPFSYPHGLHDGGGEGGAFTVGAVHRGESWGNFFHGDLGGLAIVDRGLTEAEVAAVHAQVPLPH
jgi:hypothetical protein